MMDVRIFQPGILEYIEALALQDQMVLSRQRDEIGDTLILLGHPSVITLGRRGDIKNILLDKETLLKKGVSVHETNRGGDVTYHGPGQIVGYPIMDLSLMEKDIKKYVYNIEEVFIRLLLCEFGIKAEREEKKFTGVWVGNEKIVAIGIAVRKGITMHGFAFNVNTDLSHFGWIHPCGIVDKGVTSLKKLTGKEVDISAIQALVVSYFCDVFERRAVY